MKQNYMKADMQMKNQIYYPEPLLEPELGNTATQLYLFLLRKSLLSGKSDSRYLYLELSVEEISYMIFRSPSTIKRALNRLEEAGLIERRPQGKGKKNHWYVMI